MNSEVEEKAGVPGPTAPETTPEPAGSGISVPSAVADERFDPFTSVAELAKRIRTGETTSVGIVEQFLARIEERDGELNAFVTVTPERARAAALAADRAVARGDELGALHGVPFGVKDVDSVEGVRFTSGSAAFTDRIAVGTSHAVQRLLDAGAIVIGTTNTPEYGYMGKTDSLVAGATSTPFDLTRNSGGSSGGSAAAVADGLLPFGTGSDGAGSIRIPASFTGTYGFNPSFRRIARPEGTPFEGGSTFTQQGVQTRTVEDTALALSVMAGPTDTDPHCLPNDVDYLGALEKGVEGLKVAYCPDLGVYPVDQEVRDVIDAAVGTITEAGATVERIDVDLGLEYEEIIESLRIMWATAYAEVAGNLMADYGIDVTGADREQFPDELIGLVEYGRSLSGMDVAMNNRRRTRIHQGVQEVFEEYDLLVTSTLSVAPFPNDELGPTEIEGVETDPILGWLLTAVCNMTGNPAASVPAGLTDEGLPVGMQLVGPRLADETVIAASAAYETVNPWHGDYPGL